MHRIEERKEKKPCFTWFPKHTEKEENIFGFSKANCQRATTLFASLEYAE
jgi:hypothetical protein